MALSRRSFIRSGTLASVGTVIPERHLPGIRREPSGAATPHTEGIAASAFDPKVMRQLAVSAVDAARSAGVTYADVRLTHSVRQHFGFGDQKITGGAIADRETCAIGVRALVNGHWGFAASPYWTTDEAVRLAREAAAQAQTNARGTPRQIEWQPLPAVTGHWTTPGIDPLTISIEEKRDCFNGWRLGVFEVPKTRPLTTSLGNVTLDCERQDRVMASTEGTDISQRLYSFSGNFPFSAQRYDWRNPQGIALQADGLYYQRAGWETVLATNVQAQIPRLLEEAGELLSLSTTPVMIGRYDVVFDAATTANIIAATFGKATQLDRSLGYEANAGGTSYLGPKPLDLLGKLRVASPLVTLTANRSMPGGGATVAWDDEGVVPDDFPLVQDGLLVDYLTTREQAPWLRPWYTRGNHPVRSHGCAWAPSALDVQIQHVPNLVLKPSASDDTMESLIGGVSNGFAVFRGAVNTDFQAKNGLIRGLVREIVNGKLGRVVQGAGILYGSLDFWNNVTALGGVSAARGAGASDAKGQPSQGMAYTIYAVPMITKNTTVIDVQRRA